MTDKLYKISKLDFLKIQRNQLLKKYSESELKEILGYPIRTSNHKVHFKKIINDLLSVEYRSSIESEIKNIFENIITSYGYQYLVSNFHSIIQGIGLDNIKFIMNETNNRSYNIRAIKYETIFQILDRLGFKLSFYFAHALVYGRGDLNSIIDSTGVQTKALPTLQKLLIERKEEIFYYVRGRNKNMEELFLNKIMDLYKNRPLIMTDLNSSSKLRAIVGLLLGRVITKNDFNAIKEVNKKCTKLGLIH